MSTQTPKRTPAKGKAKGRGQPAVKGCCCKRSQCIKNYCDCYQSMMVCTQFCRCVGCRNTEERLAVEPRTPARNSSAVKRDRASTINAKAAAAAKEVMNVQVPTGRTMFIPNVRVNQPPTIAPFNINRMAQESFKMLVSQAPLQQFMEPEDNETVEVVPAFIDPAKALLPEVKPKSTEPVEPELHKTHNLFVQKINEALLECILIRATEAELMGLSHIQVGQVVLTEFEVAYTEVLKKIIDICI